MKSQDVFLLLKLVSLEHRERGIPAFLESKWEDWERTGVSQIAEWAQEIPILLRTKNTVKGQFQAYYTVRALAQSTGIGKSEVSMSLQRCYEAGLAKPERISGVPRVNTKSLEEFLMYGIRYVFPVKPEQITRGIATAFASPAFRNELHSAGEIIPVWPDPKGNSRGQAVLPLYKSVPVAVRHDSTLYELLAIVDAIRIGQARERNLACKLLGKLLKSDYE